LRQRFTASSSRQNESETKRFGSLMLWKRSIEMKPSNLLTSSASPSASAL
jgi:hypothetical protein